jgi:hypothetical protein
VTILKKRTPRQEMLQNFSEARIYIGISLSDGISTSLLEAMATGCYPIQTNTSCADEWVAAESGSITKIDPIIVSKQLKDHLASDTLVDDAAKNNIRAIEIKCNSRNIAMESIMYYKNILQ